MPLIVNSRPGPATAKTFLTNGVLLATLAATAGPCAAAPAGHAPIKISRATTYLTAPVLPSGRIDYVAAINAMAKRGVTTKNNAGALVAKTFPAILANGSEGPEFTTRFYVALGERLPKAADRYVGWYAYAKEHSWPTGYGSGMVGEPDTFVGKSSELAPWTTADHPHMGAWLRANRPALQLLTRAGGRSRFYMPMLTRRPRPGTMDGILLPNLYTQGLECEMLARSAVHSMGSGHGGKCVKTIIAMYRVAALEGRQPMLISFLVSDNLAAWARHATRALVKGGYFSVSQEKAILHAMETLPRSGSLTACVGGEERYRLLDGIERMAVGDWHVQFEMLVPAGHSVAESIPPTPEAQEYPGKTFFSAVRWNKLLKHSNNLIDGNVRALREKTYAQRLAALKTIDARARTHRMKINPPPWIAHRHATTAMMQNFFWTLYYYRRLGYTLKQRCRHALQMRLTKAVLALAIYHASHGDYPASLAALTPRYLKPALTDPFTSKPLAYHQVASAYVLYGDMPDGKDGWRQVTVHGGM